MSNPFSKLVGQSQSAPYACQFDPMRTKNQRWNCERDFGKRGAIMDNGSEEGDRVEATKNHMWKSFWEKMRWSLLFGDREFGERLGFLGSTPNPNHKTREEKIMRHVFSISETLDPFRSRSGLSYISGSGLMWVGYGSDLRAFCHPYSSPPLLCHCTPKLVLDLDL